jgi:intracellular multiplication protein IcmQ
MVNPNVFYEYSVNRPIYSEKSHIDALIRTKNNKLQHGYLTVAVKKTNVLPTASESPPADTLGHVLIRVREGTLSFDRLVSFTHNLIDYKVDSYGVLVKKV